MNNFNENIIILKSANIDTEVNFDMNYHITYSGGLDIITLSKFLSNTVIKKGRFGFIVKYWNTDKLL